MEKLRNKIAAEIFIRKIDKGVLCSEELTNWCIKTANTFIKTLEEKYETGETWVEKPQDAKVLLLKDLSQTL